MDQWSSFLQERWFVLVIALVVLILVVKLVKTVVKWILALALIAAVIYYGVQYTDDLKNLNALEAIGSTVAASAKEQAMKAVANEAKDAKYVKNSDGSYTVTSKNIRVDGTPGVNEVKVTFLGQTFTVKADEIVQKYIDQAKQNS